MSTTLNKLPAYQRAIAKGHLGSCGAIYKNLDRPIIAVVNSWNEIVPGHCHLRELAEDVKRGIIEAGGYPLEFNTIAICDGIAQGHDGMKYVLPSRELIVDSIEVMIRAHGIFDGMVLLGSCDKIVPAMLMAAARLNIPAAMVTGGPMINKIKPAESKAARQQFIRGEIDEEKLVEVTVDYYPTAGVCPFLGTANTMCIVAETLGMSLPGSAAVPALSELRHKVAYDTGLVIMDLVQKDIKPRDIMSKAAFDNTVAVVLAMGGSLNTVLHLPAIAHECGLAVTYDDFDRISRYVPLITRVVPNSQEYTVADLYPVGGIPTIMNELKSVLTLDTLAINGKTLEENLKCAKPADGAIIRNFDKAFTAEGGIAVLRGNLAPEGAVVKSSAVPSDMWIFSGPAKVFDSEEECMDAIDNGGIVPGDVVVIRYEGPIGGPGMREMHRATEVIGKVGNVAIVTDGRFSGASGGLSIGYLSPEAAEEGPIGIVQNGDRIDINIFERSIQLGIDDEELHYRRTNTKPIAKQEDESEFLKLYGLTTTSSAKGAVRRKIK
ncbi:dihydroxy-acid dehydratase [Pelosinus sp. IPA-1]|uniref:dihydroxy-acid dehydratase n=1 Tax=Pelosinus sp. IPA-1 TaxID=3029569 RepID=UPI002436264F|nr:dihydroxy-acid dehydratase [Pelosinus sp. IPA-1]GMA99789.1 dihydroxy-acid dehydratase [Pelosinus sp. IPA-1]